MKVESLILRDFRNVHEATLIPDPHLNFLVGNNGQGKTSFLEALGFLATLRSFRGSRTPEVIRHGCTQAEIACKISPEAEIDTSDWKADLKVSFTLQRQQQEGGRKKATKLAFINGKAVKSSTQYLSQRFGSFEIGFHTIVFNPSDHELVRGEPALRRSFLDSVLVAEDVEYLDILQKYQRVLEQRNALFKSSDSPSPSVIALLAGFTEPLVQYGAWIAYRRLEWVKRLSESLNNTVHRIAPQQPFLRLVYVSNWAPEIPNFCIRNNNLEGVHFTGQGALPSLEIIEQAFWKRLSQLEAAEWRQRSSLVGPHRDDWAFFQGDQVLKGHGSQGEIRSALLALKLVELDLFRKKTSHRPLFLLDDFSSELDEERRTFLLQFLSETDLQVFVTTTDQSLGIADTKPKVSWKRFSVESGTLRESRA